jgi:hypothetical protein
MDRASIETKLNDARSWSLLVFSSLGDAVLHTPLTPSEHDSENLWTPLDHFAHLALIEEDFVAMARRHLAGHANPVTLLKDESGATRSREEIMAYVHSRTEKFQQEHHDDSLSEVIALTGRARAGTLALLGELTDAQLAERLPGAPWGDGTVGGVLAANADHARSHFGWVTDALREARQR